VVEAADGESRSALGELDAEFLCGCPSIDTHRRAGCSPATTDHFPGFGIGGSASVIDAIAVVLNNQFTAVDINLDQEIAQWVEINGSLRELLIESMKPSQMVPGKWSDGGQGNQRFRPKA